jgi:GTPase SAR1 family protein
MCKIIINIGFAGSGKTTYTLSKAKRGEAKRGEAKLNETRSYVINLDPASIETRNVFNLDIRDTIVHADVMESYNLGPNGAITTCLGIFATKLDQIVELIQKKSKEYDYIYVDTPGQIESFAWSASGDLILKAFIGTGVPVQINYIMDAQKCTRYATFVVNILFFIGIYSKYEKQSDLKMIFCKNTSTSKCIIESHTSSQGLETEDRLLSEIHYMFKETCSLVELIWIQTHL